VAYILVIAGSSGPTFDAVSRLSGSLLAPDGQVIRLPLKGQDAVYTNSYVRLLIQETSKYLLRFPEHEPVSVLLLYLNAKNGSEKMLLDAFFPMALPLAIGLMGESGQSQLYSANAIGKLVVEGAKRLRNIYPQVSDKTQVANLSPLLLPIRNFRSDALSMMMKQLYYLLGTHHSPADLLKEKIDQFKAIHPPMNPPDSLQRCYSDGYLYFKSPGRHRHGFFRNSPKSTHSDDCILKARSRLGGAIPYTLHYDCTPKQQLANTYPNCHCVPVAPKPNHVNIGPSDYII
jgi:hypothetical protein